MFDKFNRLDQVRTSETGGTITAQSKDHTITFLVTLPLTNKES